MEGLRPLIISKHHRQETTAHSIWQYSISPSTYDVAQPLASTESMKATAAQLTLTASSSTSRQKDQEGQGPRPEETTGRGISGLGHFGRSLFSWASIFLLGPEMTAHGDKGNRTQRRAALFALARNKERARGGNADVVH